jgi:hypothetical protein
MFHAHKRDSTQNDDPTSWIYITWTNLYQRTQLSTQLTLSTMWSRASSSLAREGWVEVQQLHGWDVLEPIDPKANWQRRIRNQHSCTWCSWRRSAVARSRDVDTPTVASTKPTSQKKTLHLKATVSLEAPPCCHVILMQRKAMHDVAIAGWYIWNLYADRYGPDCLYADWQGDCCLCCTRTFCHVPANFVARNEWCHVD